jgi:hypothetical protein
MGKGKEKVEAEPVASGSGSGDVLERLLVEIQGMRQDLRAGFRGIQMELGEIWRTRWELVGDARDLADHFLPEVGVEEVVEKDKAGLETEKGGEETNKTQN